MAWLPQSVLLFRFRVAAPTFSMPPPMASPPRPRVVVPPRAWLPKNMLLLTVSSAEAFWIPPPSPSAVDERGAARAALGLVALKRTVGDGERTPEVIQDTAAKAGCLPSHGPADGLIGDQLLVGEGHGRTSALVIDGATVTEAARARGGQVVGEDGVADVRGRGVIVTKYPRCFRWRRQRRKNRLAAPIGLVVDKRTVGHAKRRAPEIVDGSAHASAKEGPLAPSRAWFPVNVQAVT